MFKKNFTFASDEHKDVSVNNREKIPISHEDISKINLSYASDEHKGISVDNREKFPFYMKFFLK